MPWGLIAAIASLAGTGVSTGLSIAESGQKPPTPASAPTPATPTPNQGVVQQYLASQQSQAPGANPGLYAQNVASLLGVPQNAIAGQPGVQFTPAGLGSGTSNPVTPQQPPNFSDLYNSVLSG